MKRLFLLTATLLWAVAGLKAQRIEVTDAEGHGIPLVSVLTDDGVLIGTTDLKGVIADVKGAPRVALTHVAYKPQLVTVTGPTTVRMEDLDYGLDEIIVQPKPYIYVETYYRFYAFINDSLRFYQAGLLPNAYDVAKKKVETGSYYACYGDKYPSFGVGVTWGARVMEYHAGRIHKPTLEGLTKEEDGHTRYFTTLTDEGNGRKRIDNPEETLGYFDINNGTCTTTIDGGKAQMYRNRRLGQEKLLKKREDMDYAYQYTDVFKIDEAGESNIEDLVMDTNHWEWTKEKGRYKMIIETYVVDRGYMDKKEWGARKKELKKENKDVLTIDQLEELAASHHVPPLAPTMRQAIDRLGKK